MNLQQTREYFLQDRFATGQGMRVESVGENSALCTMELGEGHLNAAGIIQGGVIFTLADFAFAVASNPNGAEMVNMGSTIHFLRPPKGATLRAQAVCASAGQTTALYEVRVTDGEGRLVAQMSATAFRYGNKSATNP